mmetsp:Transcript_15657/g.39856  ORF Transcript_15657/g.39856 Transcript_15657/m.39856 type:complete len:886 (-) Transcript_15657:76-2733(-)
MGYASEPGGSTPSETLSLRGGSVPLTLQERTKQDSERRAAIAAQAPALGRGSSAGGLGGYGASQHPSGRERRVRQPEGSCQDAHAGLDEDGMGTGLTYQQEALLAPLRELLQLGHISAGVDPRFKSLGTLNNGGVCIRESKTLELFGTKLGRGLFAGRDFVKDEPVTLYGGEVIAIAAGEQRKQRHCASYVLRISDSDMLVDGFQFAGNISEKPDESGAFLPADGRSATQWDQGCGSCSNHDPYHTTSYLWFMPLGTGEAFSLLPRVPMLRAVRDIQAGEEVTYNYHSMRPFQDDWEAEDAAQASLRLEQEAVVAETEAAEEARAAARAASGKRRRADEAARRGNKRAAPVAARTGANGRVKRRKGAKADMKVQDEKLALLVARAAAARERLQGSKQQQGSKPRSHKAMPKPAASSTEAAIARNALRVYAARQRRGEVGIANGRVGSVGASRCANPFASVQAPTRRAIEIWGGGGIPSARLVAPRAPRPWMQVTKPKLAPTTVEGGQEDSEHFEVLIEGLESGSILDGNVTGEGEGGDEHMAISSRALPLLSDFWRHPQSSMTGLGVLRAALRWRFAPPLNYSTRTTARGPVGSAVTGGAAARAAGAARIGGPGCSRAERSRLGSRAGGAKAALARIRARAAAAAAAATAATDLLYADTGNADTGNTDTRDADTGNTDTEAPRRAAAADTGDVDTGTDTGNIGLGVARAGDTGNTDTGNIDTGNMDTGNTDTGNTDTGNEDARTNTGNAALDSASAAPPTAAAATSAAAVAATAPTPEVAASSPLSAAQVSAAPQSAFPVYVLPVAASLQTVQTDEGRSPLRGFAQERALSAALCLLVGIGPQGLGASWLEAQRRKRRKLDEVTHALGVHRHTQGAHLEQASKIV